MDSILFSFFQITCIVLIALWSTFKSVANIARSAGAVEASQRVRALLDWVYFLQNDHCDQIYHLHIHLIDRHVHEHIQCM